MTAVYFSKYNGVAIEIQMSKNTWTQWSSEWEQPGGHVHVRAAPAQADSWCPLAGGRDQCDQPGQWGAVPGARETHDRPRGGGGRGHQVSHWRGQAASRGGQPAQEWSARQLWQVRRSYFECCDDESITCSISYSFLFFIRKLELIHEGYNVRRASCRNLMFWTHRMCFILSHFYFGKTSFPFKWVKYCRIYKTQ